MRSEHSFKITTKTKLDLNPSQIRTPKTESKQKRFVFFLFCVLSDFWTPFYYLLLIFDFSFLSLSGIVTQKRYTYTIQYNSAQCQYHYCLLQNVRRKNKYGIMDFSLFWLVDRCSCIFCVH